MKPKFLMFACWHVNTELLDIIFSRKKREIIFLQLLLFKIWYFSSNSSYVLNLYESLLSFPWIIIIYSVLLATFYLLSVLPYILVVLNMRHCKIKCYKCFILLTLQFILCRLFYLKSDHGNFFILTSTRSKWCMDVNLCIMSCDTDTNDSTVHRISQICVRCHTIFRPPLVFVIVPFFVLPYIDFME